MPSQLDSDKQTNILYTLQVLHAACIVGQHSTYIGRQQDYGSHRWDIHKAQSEVNVRNVAPEPPPPQLPAHSPQKAHFTQDFSPQFTLHVINKIHPPRLRPSLAAHPHHKRRPPAPRKHKHPLRAMHLMRLDAHRAHRSPPASASGRTSTCGSASSPWRSGTSVSGTQCVPPSWPPRQHQPPPVRRTEHAPRRGSRPSSGR